MSLFLSIHPDNPQSRLIKQAAEIIKNGGIAVIPTAACYALVSRLDNKAGMEKLLTIRQMDVKQHLTLLCRNLNEIGQYTQLDNSQFRAIKSASSGEYTFILPASKAVPNRAVHPKNKTIGVRLIQHTIGEALLEELGEPLLACTLILPNETEPLSDPYEIRDCLSNQVDVIIDGGWCGMQSSSMIDLNDGVSIIRSGCGDVSLFE